METKNPYVSLAAVLGGLFVAVTALIVIFAGDYAWILIFIAIAFVLLGLFLGRLISKDIGTVRVPIRKR